MSHHIFFGFKTYLDAERATIGATEYEEKPKTVGYEYLADLAAAIEIPADGTLSKTIHRDESSKAVLFAFDTGQELSDHTAASPAVIYVVSGRLAVGLGDDRVEAGPNAWIHMDANLTHSVEALEPSIMLLTLVGR